MEYSEILIDDRAGSKDLLQVPPLMSATPCRLDSGDVAFTGNGPKGTITIGIEVKTVSDLLSSAKTGRLQATQIPAMIRDYDIPYLLTYGRMSASVSGALQFHGKHYRSALRHGSRPIPYSYLQALTETIASCGVQIRTAENLTTCAYTIASIYRRWQKPWSDHNGMRVFDKSGAVSLIPRELQDSNLGIRAKIAAQLPVIGAKKATVVAAHFDSVRDMVNADREEWEEIKGIGPVISKSIDDCLS